MDCICPNLTALLHGNDIDYLDKKIYNIVRLELFI